MSDLCIENIEKILDTKVRPEIMLHGGGIEVVKLDRDVLTVRFTGGCSGCPSADLTMESVVNTELKAAFPELSNVVLETGVSDDLIAQARDILKQRHRGK